jgi:hypothetical protein
MDVSATLYMALPYYLMTVAAWGTAVMCVVAVRIRIRPPWMLLLGGACLLLGVAMFLMAATAGPNGHLNRAAVAAPIRALHLGAGLLWLGWLVMFARSAVVVRR